MYESLHAAFNHWPAESGENGCVIWGGNRSGYAPGQYGKLNYGGKRLFAHRAAYELKHGPIPEGMRVDHLCHVRLCVNPDHLRLATQKQNQEHRKDANYNSLTGSRGITFDKGRSKYRVRVKHNYKEIHVGRFDTLEEAEAAAAKARRQLFTHSDKDQEKSPV